MRRSRISSFNPRVAFASLPYPGLLSLSPSGSKNMQVSIYSQDFGLLDFGLLDFGLLDFGLLDFWTLDFRLLDFSRPFQTLQDFRTPSLQQLKQLAMDEVTTGISSQNNALIVLLDFRLLAFWTLYFPAQMRIEFLIYILACADPVSHHLIPGWHSLRSLTLGYYL
ncbi:hypothetical protein ALGA_0254 [Labilibaculum antarcticum]|uniref:Uncharacterized protein n=1 Tax=Labilibaculum antarcticum TaxID=1717717 RepID=A0A1Y1CE69_9BACT|nr:hypothetical protein ALGA_0254 [Labilibaculum antarcticum]